MMRRHCIVASLFIAANFALVGAEPPHTAAPSNQKIVISNQKPRESEAQGTKTSCVACHEDVELFEPEQLAIPKKFHNDVHREIGLSCHNCHGGNPDPKLAEDQLAAMDKKYAPNPYIGAPAKDQIPEFCGRCHSSLAFMRRFKPDARVDQVQEYLTSFHGKALKKGDKNVATCIDCHGLHEIRRVSNPESRVYPTKVASTCGGCHSDPKHMAGYHDEHGRPLATDQVARWKRSVHADAMFKKGDLTAPTCNDCHGNHGAAPPGVEAVAFVCGNCHGREAELFQASEKHKAFAEHNEMAEGAKCSECHDDLAPNVVNIPAFSECITCHENHAVARPTIALLGSLPDTPCALCHEPSSPVMEPERVRQHYASVRNALLADAQRSGRKGDDRFNWLVDQALTLPVHTLPREAGAAPKLRPEFERLFKKFRIGKTRYDFIDGDTKQKITVDIRQCEDCHSAKTSEGMKAAQAQLRSMRQVIGTTARAERLLLAAQRGGVETREAHAALDAAVDSQVELEVLVHTFHATGPFAAKYREGLQQATHALDAGKHSLEELAYRRRGLFVTLGIIALVLIALALKIKQLGG